MGIEAHAPRSHILSRAETLKGEEEEKGWDGSQRERQVVCYVRYIHNYIPNTYAHTHIHTHTHTHASPNSEQTPASVHGRERENFGKKWDLG